MGREANPSILHIDGLEIELSSDLSHLSEKLSKKALIEFCRLVEMAQENPHSAFDDVLSFKTRHPHLPEADNLLTYLHLIKKEVALAEKLIEESYAKHPNYLFAQINYADQSLRKKQYHKVKEIFPYFDLQKLFPKRKKFHVSEYRGFMTLFSHYFLEQNQLEMAMIYYKNAHLADSSHPSVVLLEKKIRKKKFSHFLTGKIFLKKCRQVLARIS